MKKRSAFWLAALLCALAVTLCGCDRQSASVSEPSSTDAPAAITKAGAVSIDDAGITDSPYVYLDDDEDSVTVFYLTITRGTAADNTNHSFADVNSVIKLQGMTSFEDVRARVLVQEGDESGPLPGMLGYGQTLPNGVIRLRGRTSTTAAQKSYRIDLMESAGLWRGQTGIALNKHAGENLRFRNKLYFDLLRDIPDITSLRTQFVHVYVRDLTCDPPQTAFEDYGLFTQIEIPNKRFLRNHELNRSGYLYKANMFEMFRYPEQLRLTTDPLYSLEAFSTVLEPKGNENHAKLLEMLEAVNDYTRPIEETFETYFDSDNYMTYYAYNLITANDDSNAQNHLLYSPVNGNTWYYLPWDGDDCLHNGENDMLDINPSPDWHNGISNYWGIVLFNRLFRLPEYRDRLTAKVNELYALLTDGRVEKLVSMYRAAVEPFAFTMPDIMNLRVTPELYDRIANGLMDEIHTAYQVYMNGLKKPMPFYLSDAEISDGMLFLNWDGAYDFAGELITYRVQVARDATFSKDVMVLDEETLGLSVTFPARGAGEYVWRVTATNESGQTQMAFDQFECGDTFIFGARHFYVTEEGTVVDAE